MSRGWATGRRSHARDARRPSASRARSCAAGRRPVRSRAARSSSRGRERVERAVGERTRQRPDAADLAVGCERLHDRPPVPRLARDEREAHGFGEAELGAAPARSRLAAGRAPPVRFERGAGERLVVVVPVGRRRRSHATRSRAPRAAAARSSPPITSHRYTIDTTLCGLPCDAGLAREHADELVDARDEPDLFGDLAHDGLLRASRSRRPNRRSGPSGRRRPGARAGCGRARRRSRRRRRPWR